MVGESRFQSFYSTAERLEFTIPNVESAVVKETVIKLNSLVIVKIRTEEVQLQ
jgi:hypothetical protein